MCSEIIKLINENWDSLEDEWVPLSKRPSWRSMTICNVQYII
jgi:hypothetical protein